MKRFDTTLIAGDTWQPASFVLRDRSGVSYDLTGVAGTCQVRTEPGGALLLEPEVHVTDPAGGAFTIVAAAASTAVLQPGTGRYAIRLTWPDGTVRTVVEGRLTIRRAIVEVTDE